MGGKGWQVLTQGNKSEEEKTHQFTNNPIYSTHAGSKLKHVKVSTLHYMGFIRPGSDPHTWQNNPALN